MTPTHATELSPPSIRRRIVMLLVVALFAAGTPLAHAAPPDFTLQKTADNPVVNAGDPIGFTITTTAVAGLTTTVTDPLPSVSGTSWTIDVPGSDSGCSINGATQELDCFFPVSHFAATHRVHVTSTTTATIVPPGTRLLLKNTVTAVFVGDSGLPLPARASALVEVDGPLFLVTKTADRPVVNAGDPIGFTIAVTSTVQVVFAFSDPLPSFTGASWTVDEAHSGLGCQISGIPQRLDCNSPRFPPLITYGVHVTSTTTAATVPAGQKLLLTNSVTATLSDFEEGFLLGTGHATATVEVDGPRVPPHIELAKTADDNPESRGDEVGFTITATNTGGAPAHDVVVRDVLPTGTDIHWSIATPVPGCSIAGNVLTCTRASLDAGGSLTVHVTSPTSFSTECTTLHNTATATSSDGGSATANASIRLKCADVEIAKTADESPQSAGERIGFVIKVKNEGDDGAVKVSVTDPLPSAPGLEWSIPDPVSGCFINNNLLTCHRSWMDPGESFSVHVVSSTGVSTGCRTLDNEASVTSANGGSDEASASIRLTCTHLEITHAVDAQSVTAGEPIGFVVKVTNAGNDEARTVSLTDPLPAGAGLQWSLASPVTGCSISGNDLTCTRSALAPGESFSVHATSPTTASSCGDHANTASVQSFNAGAGSDGGSVTVRCVSYGAPVTDVLANRDHRSPDPAADPPSTLATDLTSISSPAFSPLPGIDPSSIHLGRMPGTGFDSGPLGITALLLIAAGGALAAIGRRRSARRGRTS